jgi:glutathione synthase/RimK-type ligase-like ATP-grasp enzyme
MLAIHRTNGSFSDHWIVYCNQNDIFPNAKTSWHYDDKLGPKFLLEATGPPHVPTYVFYDKNQALNWAKTRHYPKVFKLRRGAGSMNVILVRHTKQATSLIRRGFAPGWHDPREIPEECVALAFRAAEALDSQCVACDFIYHEEKPLIVEISKPQSFMVEDFVHQCKDH